MTEEIALVESTKAMTEEIALVEFKDATDDVLPYENEVASHHPGSRTQFQEKATDEDDNVEAKVGSINGSEFQEKSMDEDDNVVSKVGSITPEVEEKAIDIVESEVDKTIEESEDERDHVTSDEAVADEVAPVSYHAGSRTEFQENNKKAIDENDTVEHKTEVVNNYRSDEAIEPDHVTYSDEALHTNADDLNNIDIADMDADDYLSIIVSSPIQEVNLANEDRLGGWLMMVGQRLPPLPPSPYSIILEGLNRIYQWKIDGNADSPYTRHTTLTTTMHSAFFIYIILALGNHCSPENSIIKVITHALALIAFCIVVVPYFHAMLLGKVASDSRSKETGTCCRCM
ncbi:hypothetical protein L6452_31838 [Arctium lappa]|uniref:Uncharacterized protein n=1 Tax=Arctium lappa TaxID=4217 RepID=A0ACB8Z237_ARCLA|nr:hypothetical protein L6452_31838 [Arctium lappa]